MSERSDGDGGRSRIRIYGRLGSAQAYMIRDFLHRSGVPFDWVDLCEAEERCPEAGVVNPYDARLPVCAFPDGTRLECPTVRQITEKLGLFQTPSQTEYELAIYGAGPAGLSAAVYGSSDGLRTVLVERWAFGGQAGSSSRIENYLGFPDGVSGAELADAARRQAIKFGAEILIARAGVRAEFPPGKGVVHLDDGTQVVARASICATGVEYRRLGLPDEDRFLGAGLYYGAGASEAQLVNGQHVYIVGGGNSAGQAAMHFAPVASRVTMVVRGPSLKETLSQYLIDRILSTPAVEVLTGQEVTALHGDEMLEEITIADRAGGTERRVATHWLFVCIGGVPNTQWAQEVGVERDDGGYLLTGPDLLRDGHRPPQWQLDRDPLHLETSMPGVFAAGDVRHGSIKRCAAAVGEGAMAVSLVHRFLDDR